MAHSEIERRSCVALDTCCVVGNVSGKSWIDDFPMNLSDEERSKVIKTEGQKPSNLEILEN